MEIGIDDIDMIDFKDPADNDSGQTITEVNFGDNLNYTKEWVDGPDNQEPVKQPQNNTNDVDTDPVITKVLQSKGIKDQNDIKFQNDAGELESKKWSDLTDDEKINILSTQDQTTNIPDLDDSEIALLNDIRSRNLTPEQYLQQVIQANQIQQPAQEPIYQVDGISDDELYMLDLKSRTPDVTDEELLQFLEQAKQNDQFYKKQIQGIRQEYKQLEDQRIKDQQAIEQQQQQDSYNQFANTIINSINGLTEVGGLDIELDDEDKQELADFILGYDSQQHSNLDKALRDPETLTKMSWFALKGIDTIDGMVDYFKNEIKNVRENSYRQGMLDAQKGNKIPPRVVVTQPKSTTTYKQNQGEIKTIDDLD